MLAIWNKVFGDWRILGVGEHCLECKEEYECGRTLSSVYKRDLQCLGIL